MWQQEQQRFSMLISLAILVVLLTTPIIQYNPPSEKNNHIFQLYAEKWWQWIVSIPGENNPQFDKTGDLTQRANAHTGVFFLAAGINQSEPFVRNITIEQGRPLFFPILVGGYSDVPKWYTPITDLYRCVTDGICNIYEKLLDANHIDLIDITKHLHFTIDGKNMPYQRITTVPYNVDYPAANPFKVAKGVHTTVVDGYWAYVENLAVGNHTILFGGHSPPDYFTTIIYEVEVI
jgi:hypothetical protein